MNLSERINGLLKGVEVPTQRSAVFAEGLLRTCVEEMDLAQSGRQPDRLRDRMMIWTAEEIRARVFQTKSHMVPEVIPCRGELDSDEAGTILGTKLAFPVTRLQSCGEPQL